MQDYSSNISPQAQETSASFTQDSNPGLVCTFETNRAYRIHRSYIWLAPGIATLAFLFALTMGSLETLRQFVGNTQAITSGGIIVAFVLITVAIIAAIIYGIFVAFYAWAYKNMWFVFNDKEFSFYSGIFFKKHVHLPYNRIQSVNHRATFVQRLAGVCTITVESAGGSANKSIRVPYVQLNTAERIRNEVFTRKAAITHVPLIPLYYDPRQDPTTPIGNGYAVAGIPVPPLNLPVQQIDFNEDPTLEENTAASSDSNNTNVLDKAARLGTWRGAYGGESVIQDPVSFKAGLTNSELILTSFSQTSPFAAGALIVSMTLPAVIPLINTNTFAITAALSAIGIGVVAMLIGWILSAIGVAFQYGGFQIRRRGSRIEVERGIFQRDFSGIDIDRIQTLNIKQTLPRRLLGYCEISVGRITTSEESSQGATTPNIGKLIIHPFVKSDYVDEFIDTLLPEFADRPLTTNLYKVPAKSKNRAFNRNVLWRSPWFWTVCALIVAKPIYEFTGFKITSLGLSASTMALIYTGVRAFVLLVVISSILRAIKAYLWVKGSGYTWSNKYAAILNSGFTADFVIIPRQKIQCAYTRANPFQDRLSLASIHAQTAATAQSNIFLWDVPVEHADLWLAWAAPGNASKAALTTEAAQTKIADERPCPPVKLTSIQDKTISKS